MDTHPDAERVAELPLHDMALHGKNPRSNMKAMLRIKLLGAGYDPAVVSMTTAADHERPDLAIVDVSTKKNTTNRTNTNPQKELLKKAGFDVKSIKTGSSQTAVTWRSLTHTSPWLVDKASRRMLVVAGTNIMITQRATCGFILDCWRSTNFDDTPERMPRFGRFNLLSWMSPDALQRWPEVNKNVDIAVVYGGLHSESDIHPVLGYLSAMAASFHGFLLYEALLPSDISAEQIDNASRRYNVVMVANYVSKLMSDGALNGE